MTTRDIKLTIVRTTDRSSVRRKTLKSARQWAHRLAGEHPRLDPDGYAVGPHGVCVFFQGATFEELWGPDEGPQ